MRDKFLSMNRWNEGESKYVSLTAPRDMSKLTRAQVQAETTRFLKMYRYDEGNNNYVLRVQ